MRTEINVTRSMWQKRHERFSTDDDGAKTKWLIWDLVSRKGGPWERKQVDKGWRCSRNEAGT